MSSSSLAFHITSETSDDGFGGTYLRLRVAPVVLDPAGERMTSITWDDIDRPQLADFCVHAQNDSRHAAAGQTSYGFASTFEQLNLNAERAKLIARVLASLNRKLAATEQVFGRPTTFGAYLLRVAHALGISRFVRLSTQHQPIVMTALDAESWIGHLEQQYLERYAPAA